jgi:hypothetical protein
MQDLLGATMISEPKREEVKHAIMTISTEGFMPAFEHLKRIRVSKTQQMPVLNRLQLFEDFSRVLWHAYKDLLQKAATVSGTNIGFLFQTDANFAKGLAEFEKEHTWVPKAFGEFLRVGRKNWQNELSDFRNHFLEHRQEEPAKYKDFYQPENAEALFDTAWRTTVEILVILLAKHFPPSVGLAEIPSAERSGTPPRRFQFVLLGPTPQPLRGLVFVPDPSPKVG